MNPQVLTPTQESSTRLPGTWKLGAGRAITLRPTEAGTMRVAHGRIWATYDGPHGLGPADSGDQVVGSGAALPVRAGQRLVMEAWSGGQPAYFSWEPAPAPQAREAPRLASVTQPMADLRLALVFGGGAFARLLAGLVRFALWRALPRRAAAAPCGPA